MSKKPWRLAQRSDAVTGIASFFGYSAASIANSVASWLSEPIPGWAHFVLALLSAVLIVCIVRGVSSDRAKDQDSSLAKAIRQQLEQLTRFEQDALRELRRHGGLTGHQFAQLMGARGYPIKGEDGRELKDVYNALQGIAQKTTLLDRTMATATWFVKTELIDTVDGILKEEDLQSF